MKERFESEVANGVATFQDKRKYVSPEIEVINLDSQPQLLAQSAVPSRFGAGFGEDEGSDW